MTRIYSVTYKLNDEIKTTKVRAGKLCGFVEDLKAQGAEIIRFGKAI